MGTGQIEFVLITEAGPNEFNIYITERPADPEYSVDYTFTVKDESGNPVPGVAFNIMKKTAFMGTMSAISDSSGVVRFQLVPGEYYVSVDSRVVSSERRWSILNSRLVHFWAPIALARAKFMAFGKAALNADNL